MHSCGCVLEHVREGAYTHECVYVEARGHYQVSPPIILHFIFDEWHLPEYGAHHLDGLAGQQASRTRLSLPCFSRLASQI